MHAQMSIPQFRWARLTNLALLMGEHHLEEEQLVLIKHKLLQENRLLIQESQLWLPWPSNLLQLLFQGSASSFESFCTLVYNKRQGCLTLNHISAYADWDLIDTRYNFARQ